MSRVCLEQALECENAGCCWAHRGRYVHVDAVREIPTSYMHFRRMVVLMALVLP